MEYHFLRDLTILFGASVLASYLFRALRLSTIAGFLVAGAAIGPGGLALIESTEEVRQMEEIGVMLLLFSIGVEFSIDKLRRGGRTVLAGGSSQVLTTGLAVGAAAALLGAPASLAVFIGMLAALSSTVIGLRLLHERGLTTAPQGQVSLSILIFQDLAFLPMMLVLPMVAGAAAVDAPSLIGTLAVSAAAIGLILVSARVAVPWLIRKTVHARSRDVFILSVIVTLVGISWVSSQFGISAGLGAFIAGLVISESEYSHQVLSDVLPFRETFNSVFFVSVGMLIDTGFVLENAAAIGAAAVGVMVLKAVITGGAVRLLGYPWRIALAVGLLLSQVGEFSIVLLHAAPAEGFLTGPVEQALLSTILVTMVLSTLVQKASERIPLRAEEAPAPAGEGGVTLSDHVVVIGYGLNGRNAAAMLQASDVPYAVLEMNPRTVSRASAEGVPIHYGDAASDTVLERMGVARARIVVFAISEPDATRQGVAAARRLNPGAYVVARTRYTTEIEPLYAAGADTVITEEFETSLTIIRRIMDRLGVHPTRIDDAVLEIRQQHYAPFLESDVHGIQTGEGIRTYERVVRAAADGRSIGALRIREQTGATLVAVEREGRLTTSPGPDFVLREGDRVHLIGSEQEVERALTLL